MKQNWEDILEAVIHNHNYSCNVKWNLLSEKKKFELIIKYCMRIPRRIK